MFGVVAFSLAVVAREFVSGARARRRDDRRGARPRCSRSCAATAVATAATWCTPGSRCCSSASPRRGRSTTSATCGSRPARPRRSAAARSLRQGDLRGSTTRPTPARPQLRRGARRRQGRQARRHAAPGRDYYPSSDRRSARSPASSRASRPARSACAGVRSDLWTAIQPDLSILQKPVRHGRPALSATPTPKVKGTILSGDRPDVPRARAVGDLPGHLLPVRRLDLVRRRAGPARRDHRVPQAARPRTEPQRVAVPKLAEVPA